MYELFKVHSGYEGQAVILKDVKSAYRYLLDAIYTGVTYFDEAKRFFKENVGVLAGEFAKNNPHLTLDMAKSEDIIARHGA